MPTNAKVLIVQSILKKMIVQAIITRKQQNKTKSKLHIVTKYKAINLKMKITMINIGCNLFKIIRQKSQLQQPREELRGISSHRVKGVL